MNQWEMEARFAREGDFDCFLLAGRYTLLDQSSLAYLMPVGLEKNISLVLGGPYNSGILASDLGPGATYNYESASVDIIEKARRIKAVCDRSAVPLKAAALQFGLLHLRWPRLYPAPVSHGGRGEFPHGRALYSRRPVDGTEARGANRSARSGRRPNGIVPPFTIAETIP